MRISDWSSDVCSSDLRRRHRGCGAARDPENAGEPAMSDLQTEAAVPTAAELRQVIHIVEDLTAVMSREVELLRAMRVRDFGELQDHKLGLVQAYEKQTEHLRANPAFAAAIDPVLREELTDVIDRKST